MFLSPHKTVPKRMTNKPSQMLIKSVVHWIFLSNITHSVLTSMGSSGMALPLP